MDLNFNINTLTRERLLKFPGVSPKLADFILARRKKVPFLALDELKDAPGVSQTLLRKLANLGLQATIPPLLPLEPPRLVLPGVLVPTVARDPSSAAGQFLLALGNLFTAAGGLLLQEPPPVPWAPRPREADDESKPAISIPDTSERRERDATDAQGNRVNILEVLPGYCTIAWILLGGAGPGDGNGASALGAGATGSDAVLTPTQGAVNSVANDIVRANGILRQCDVSLLLCAVYVLDTRQLRTADGRNTLSDLLFDPGGVIYGEGTPNHPLRALYDLLDFRLPDRFPKRCTHLFYARDVQKSPRNPDTPTLRVTGVGAMMGSLARERDPQYTSMGIVEGGSGRSVAHEFVHGHGDDGSRGAVDRSGGTWRYRHS